MYVSPVLSRSLDPAAPRLVAADAFVRLERILDCIRRGELEATPDERDRIAAALDALRGLQRAA